jgi:HAD superfamily hydrolase (TIGR01484 family)
MDLSLHLVSDLDGTWIPPQEDLAGLRELEDWLTGLHGLTLTFATGRTLHSALTDLTGLVLLWPAHFVTDVGTAIYHRTSRGKWIEDADYARKVNALWDQDAADRVSLRLPPGIRHQPGLRPRRRLAMEILPGVELLAAAEELEQCLGKAWFPVDVLPSNGVCLDVLPKGVDKGTAVEHLDLQVHQPSLLVACGDSENDLGMFRKADMAVVMADSPLQEAEIGLSEQRVLRPKRRGPAGILEALRSLQARTWPDRNPERATPPFPLLGSNAMGGRP